MSFDLVRDFTHVKSAPVLCYETDLCHLLQELVDRLLGTKRLEAIWTGVGKEEYSQPKETSPRVALPWLYGPVRCTR
jgi:hypothetical protein